VLSWPFGAFEAEFSNDTRDTGEGGGKNAARRGGEKRQQEEVTCIKKCRRGRRNTICTGGLSVTVFSPYYLLLGSLTAK